MRDAEPAPDVQEAPCPRCGDVPNMHPPVDLRLHDDGCGYPDECTCCSKEGHAWTGTKSQTESSAASSDTDGTSATGAAAPSPSASGATKTSESTSATAHLIAGLFQENRRLSDELAAVNPTGKNAPALCSRCGDGPNMHTFIAGSWRCPPGAPGEPGDATDRIAALLYDHGLRSGDYATYDQAFCRQVAVKVLAATAPGEPGEGARETHIGPHPAYDYATTHKGRREECASPECRAEPGEPGEGDALAYLHEPCGCVMTARWVEETRGACGGCEYVGMEDWTPLAARAEAAGLRSERDAALRRDDYAMETTRQAQAEAAGLRERLAAVEALATEWERRLVGPGVGRMFADIRAALAASPEVAPGAEPVECCASGRCEVCTPGYQW